MKLVLAIGITVITLICGWLYFRWSDQFYNPPPSRKYKGMDPDKIDKR